MRLRTILIEAFEMLRERPVLFLPRIVSSLVWSGFWVWLVGAVQYPFVLDPALFQRVVVFLVIMAPLQVWVYNAYFVVVEQYREGTVSIMDALREGLVRLPQGLAALFIPAVVVGVGAVPGIYLAAAGVATGDIVLQLAGVVFALTVLILTGIYFYFTPVAVVLGDDSFRANFRDGLDASRENRRLVVGVTVLSIIVLALTTALEGGARAAGIAGFVLARLVHAVISVYLLVVNPEFYLSVEEGS